MTVRCPSCGRQDQWPQPELGCGCGTVLRIPVRPAPSVPPAGPRPAPAPHRGRADAAGPGLPTGADASTGPGPAPEPDLAGDPDLAPGSGPEVAPGSGPDLAPGSGPDLAPGSAPGLVPGPAPAARPAPAGQLGGGSRAGRPRPPFRPLTIRTARDAVTAAAVYLKWLGFRDILQSPEHPASGIDLRAPGLVAQVDPRTEPSTLRDVECLWLHGLNSSAVPVFFSLTGYVPEARARAANLGVPLFVMDLTGTPQPANDAADLLIRTGG
ncbi:hypothetical protein ACIQM4_01980 [Streptomyces sp. NPDC091272]|uniref:hypothetical protein n=1 Tax=Streptomyces sp. NPDC091272 TaxID=3365981 RepID=UPI00382259A0